MLGWKNDHDHEDDDALDNNDNFADHSDEAVMVVSLVLASLATILNVAIEVQPYHHKSNYHH